MVAFRAELDDREWRNFINGMLKRAENKNQLLKGAYNIFGFQDIIDHFKDGKIAAKQSDYKLLNEKKELPHSKRSPTTRALCRRPAARTRAAQRGSTTKGTQRATG